MYSIRYNHQRFYFSKEHEVYRIVKFYILKWCSDLLDTFEKHVNDLQADFKRFKKYKVSTLLIYQRLWKFIWLPKMESKQTHEKWLPLMKTATKKQGWCSWYRKFIPDFEKVLGSLTNLFYFDEGGNLSFVSLKQ